MYRCDGARTTYISIWLCRRACLSQEQFEPERPPAQGCSPFAQTTPHLIDGARDTITQSHRDRLLLLPNYRHAVFLVTRELQFITTQLFPPSKSGRSVRRPWWRLCFASVIVLDTSVRPPRLFFTSFRASFWFLPKANCVPRAQLFSHQVLVRWRVYKCQGHALVSKWTEGRGCPFSLYLAAAVYVVYRMLHLSLRFCYTAPTGAHVVSCFHSRVLVYFFFTPTSLHQRCECF